MISLSEEKDFNEIYELINDAALAYRGIIPARQMAGALHDKRGVEKAN